MWSFGNNPADGYMAKPYEYNPAWQKDVDYNPDHQRSTGAMFIEDCGADIRWVLGVRGLGVIVMRAGSDPDTGRLDFKGVSNFTDSEIGWRS